MIGNVPRILIGLTGGIAIILVVGILLGGVGAGGASAAPHYADETATAGVDHVYDGDFAFFVGGGVAVFDCNADGRPELYFAGGTNPATLYRNDSPVGGALAFEPMPDPATDLVDVTGAYPLDVDGDGVTDLAVLRRGENVLLRGLGDCRFERANEDWAFDGGDLWTTAFSATWEDGASWPTIALGSYVDERASTRRTSARTTSWSGPHRTGAASDRSSRSPQAGAPCRCCSATGIGPGRRDLRVSNDRHYYTPEGGGEEQLWRMTSGQAPTLYTARGWLAARPGVGHGHRQLRRHGRRIP